jgi:hypothetical protein
MRLPAWIIPTLLLAWPGLTAQTSAPTGTETAPLLEWRGQYGGNPEASADAVLDAHHWNRLWKSLERAAPPLDFTMYCAVVAYAGLKPTGGFTLDFLDPVPRGDDLLIRWRVRAPAPDSYTTQALARPWQVKAFPRPKGKVLLERAVD